MKSQEWIELFLKEPDYPEGVKIDEGNQERAAREKLVSFLETIGFRRPTPLAEKIVAILEDENISDKKMEIAKLGMGKSLDEEGILAMMDFADVILSPVHRCDFMQDKLSDLKEVNLDIAQDNKILKEKVSSLKNLLAHIVILISFGLIFFIATRS